MLQQAITVMIKVGYRLENPNYIEYLQFLSLLSIFIFFHCSPLINMMKNLCYHSLLLLEIVIVNKLTKTNKLVYLIQ